MNNILLNSIGGKNVGVILEAGLGNQLFMIFALISYCIDNLCNYTIYYRADEPRRTYWNTILESFANNATMQAPNSNIMKYQEPHFHHSKIPVFDCDVNFKGYFQSHKYFEHNLSNILKYMNFQKKLDAIKREYTHFLQKKCIALHFRIGDYIGLQPYHPIQQPYYYLRALKYMIETLKKNGDDISNYNILYFCQGSDNNIVEKYLQIFRENLGTLNFVKVPDNIDDWKQLLLMTCCEHFIIANSTFSWFPAYIAENTQKDKKIIICYPLHWFGELYANHNTDDLFPISWKGFDDRP